jgi:DNA repair protein RadC
MTKKKTYKIPSYRLQLVRDGEIMAKEINCAKLLARADKKLMKSDRERFVCFYLDGRNRAIAHQTISTGTLNACLVHPREVFKTAILKNACSIAVVHNHPSGELAPSEADVLLTERLKDAGKLLGIELIDHIIVNPAGETKSLIT